MQAMPLYPYPCIYYSITDYVKAKQSKQSCKKTGEGRGLYTHQII